MFRARGRHSACDADKFMSPKESPPRQRSSSIFKCSRGSRSVTRHNSATSFALARHELPKLDV